jgi:hypothetical protein
MSRQKMNSGHSQNVIKDKTQATYSLGSLLQSLVKGHFRFAFDEIIQIDSLLFLF